MDPEREPANQHRSRLSRRRVTRGEQVVGLEGEARDGNDGEVLKKKKKKKETQEIQRGLGSSAFLMKRARRRDGREERKSAERWRRD